MEYENHYASNAKGNLGVTLGAIGSGLGLLAGGTGLLSGTGANYVSKDTYDIQLQLIGAERKNAILQADLDSEKKMVQVFNAATEKIAAVRDELGTRITNLEKTVDANAAAQSVINCGLQSANAVLQNQVAMLMGMTKTVIPITNICPQPAVATTQTAGTT